VANYDDLQKLVIVNNLQDKVPSLNEPIGLNKLYRAYKPFLWINFKRVQKENKPYLQLIATNPDTLEEVFVSEVFLDFLWAGVNDQNSRYPLFNALIEWLNKNK
jgi:predicted HAD superfamily phosphohydrolase YqeG